MTNDQCIQVAEKIWGWKRTGGKWKDHDNEIWEDENGGVIRYWDGLSMMSIEQCVNSWSGFGRTVQRMRGHPNYGEFSVKCSVYLNGYLAEMTGVSYMFEATHLAALEAVREGK